MIYEPETVKGFQDFLPPESQKRKAIKEIIEKLFALYGFLPIETPAIEFEELMRSDAVSEEEDEAVSDRFRLRDRGNRNLGLRYEFTFQLKRLFKQNPNIKLPFKRYQIGSVFRDEPTSSNRFREFTQCDADIIGDQSIEADAECLSLFSEILKELKINPEIEINSRKLINAILDSVQIQNKLQVMRELDKLEKFGEDTIKGSLRKYADANQILTLFKLLEKSLDFFEKNLFDGSEDLKKLQQLSKVYNFEVKFNPRMIRGLSYYTGNIFEIKVAGTKESVAAGGRYDKTVGKYLNKEIPAVGISFGLERLAKLAKVEIEKTKVVVISINQDKEAIKLAQKLRKNDISSEILFGKLGKSLEYANSTQAEYVIFVGKEELEKNKFKLRNMSSGEEKLLAEKQLISKLGK